MKYFDPANHPKGSSNRVTIYGSVLTLSGTTTNGKSATVAINGINNLVDATIAGTSLTTAATNWVTANYAYYITKGYKVSSAAAVITVVPAWDWDTVNRIKVTITTVDTLTGSLTGVFEPDLAKAKVWQVTFGQAIAIKRPRNMREGDRIRLELKATGNYATTYPTDSSAYYFPGGTENVQTSTSIDTVTGTVNIAMFPREDRITLTGTTGTANITAGGLTKLATFATGGSTDLTQTAADFVTSWAAAYLAIGLTVTSAAAVITFAVTSSDQKDKANFYKVPTIANVTTDLSGTVVNVPAGRILVDAAAKDLKQ